MIGGKSLDQMMILALEMSMSEGHPMALHYNEYRPLSIS